VDDEQIPLRRRERLPERWPPCGGEGGDEHRWVASRRIVGDAGGREDVGRKGELALQLLTPLLDEARWDEDQDPPRDATQAQLRQDEAGLILAERSEEHTSELQSPDHLVCRLLLEKKNRSRERQTHVTRGWISPRYER